MAAQHASAQQSHVGHMGQLKDVDTLVFSGGGVRGLAYVGALMAFQDKFGTSAHAAFKTFAGTSVGAIFALVCAIGYDISKAVAAFETVGLEAIFDKDPTYLLTQYSLNSGQSIEILVRHILEAKNFREDITMHDLYMATKKHLIVTVIDLDTTSVLYLDHTNEGRSMPVIKAVMGSMALPPLYPPVTHGTLTMIDGGLLDNFPLAKFDSKKALGLRTAWYLEPISATKDLYTYYTRILGILQLNMHRIQSAINCKSPHVVFIDLGPMNSYDSAVDTKSLVFSGYRAAMNHFLAPGPTVFEEPTKYLTGQDGRQAQAPAYLKKLAF